MNTQESVGLRLQCLNFAQSVFGDRAAGNIDDLFGLAEQTYGFVTNQTARLAEPPKSYPLVFPAGIKPYDYQITLATKIMSTERVAINKARQMGVTTTLITCAAHLLRTRPDYLIVYVTAQHAQGISVIDRIASLIPVNDLDTTQLNKSNIHLLNGSRVIARSGGPDHSKGLCPNLVIIDDVWDNQLEPTLSALRPGINAVVASSPVADSFRKLWLSKEWHQAMLPYFLNPERDENFVRTMRDRIGQNAFRREFCCEFI